MHLESELASARQQLHEQEIESSDAIAKWQQSSIELEGKCAELEEKLQNATFEEGSTEIKDSPESDYFESKEDNASLREKIKSLEINIAKRQEALEVAQETLARDLGDECEKAAAGHLARKQQLGAVERLVVPAQIDVDGQTAAAVWRKANHVVLAHPGGIDEARQLIGQPQLVELAVRAERRRRMLCAERRDRTASQQEGESRHAQKGFV